MQNNNGVSQYIQALNEKGEIAFVPQGDSMYPFIKNKSQYVIVKKYNGEKLQKYDVIFYNVNGNAVLHRIIGFYDGGYITCGDGNITNEYVKQQDVFGILKGFYKKEKFIDSRDEKYLKKVEKWYKHPFYKKMSIKLYRFIKRVR